MKIIHTSDLHLGSPMNARLTDEKARVRGRELFDTLYRITEHAEKIGAAAIIIAGDLFDSPRISRKKALEVLAIIRAKSDISFFYLSGNHERDGLIRYEDELPENLFVFGNEWTYFELGEVVIAGRCTLSADMFDSLKAPEEKKLITVLHGALSDAARTKDDIALPSISGHGIDYLALGHYHSYSVERIDERGVAVYSGTPEGRGFDEAGDKGFVIIDVNEKGLTHSFLPFSKRQVVVVEADVTDAKSVYDVNKVLEAALTNIGSENIVRAVFTGTRSGELIIDTAAYTSRYKNYFFYFEAKDNSRLKINAEDYKNDKSLKGEFIRLVLSKDNLKDEEKAKILKCGVAALMGDTYDE